MLAKIFWHNLPHTVLNYNAYSNSKLQQIMIMAKNIHIKIKQMI